MKYWGCGVIRRLSRFVLSYELILYEFNLMSCDSELLRLMQTTDLPRKVQEFLYYPVYFMLLILIIMRFVQIISRF